MTVIRGMGLIRAMSGAALCAAGLFVGSGVQAQNDGSFQGELEVGFEYDDNITVDATDTTSRIGDEVWRISGRLGFDLYNKDRDTVTMRYSFFQSLHDELETFDLQMHGLSMRGKTRIGKVNVGATVRYDHILLGGAAFMDFKTFRPDIGWLVARRTYLTATYEYRNQTFKDPFTALDRDADRHSLASKVYYVLGRGKNITAGARIARHKAGLDELSYWGKTFDAGLKWPFPFQDRNIIFRLRYQYRDRDYSGVEPTIGAERSDKRHTVRTELEVPFTKHLSAGLEYRYTRSISNLTVADYKNNVVRFSLIYQF